MLEGRGLSPRAAAGHPGVWGVASYAIAEDLPLAMTETMKVLFVDQAES
jgi:hypothetical protein